MEDKNKLSLVLLTVCVVIGLIVAGIGLIKQIDAKKLMRKDTTRLMNWQYQIKKS